MNAAIEKFNAIRLLFCLTSNDDIDFIKEINIKSELLVDERYAMPISNVPDGQNIVTPTSVKSIPSRDDI